MLRKFSIQTTEDASTRTVVTDYNGLIFSIHIFNNNSQDNNCKIYIDNGCTLYNEVIPAGKSFSIKPEIRLDVETLKFYGELSGLDVIVQILED